MDPKVKWKNEFVQNAKQNEQKWKKQIWHHNMFAKKLILCMFDELKLQGIKWIKISKFVKKNYKKQKQLQTSINARRIKVAFKFFKTLWTTNSPMCWIQLYVCCHLHNHAQIHLCWKQFWKRSKEEQKVLMTLKRCNHNNNYSNICNWCSVFHVFSVKNCTIVASL
jgi:hypothetical protein